MTNILWRLNIFCPLSKIQTKTMCALLILTYYTVRKMAGIEIVGSLITRGKHLTVIVGMGPRYWQPGSG